MTVNSILWFNSFNTNKNVKFYITDISQRTQRRSHDVALRAFDAYRKVFGVSNTKSIVKRSANNDVLYYESLNANGKP